MGLKATAKGLTDETEFNCGYFIFGEYRLKVAKAYDSRFGELFEKWAKEIAIPSELKELETIEIPDGLGIFLMHSDSEGKFTPNECKKIYNDLKDLKIEMQGHNYGVMKLYNMHEHWLNMFLHCAKRRVNMYFR